MPTDIQSVIQDLRYALRQLRRSPGFAVTAVLTLALGIGANTAIFSLLDQALLRSLPVRDPKQLVVLEGTGKAWEGHTSNHGGDEEAYFSYPMYRDLRDLNKAFTGLIATAPADIGVLHRGASQNARAEIVSGNYFSVLGVEPALGRLLAPSDDVGKGANPVAVLSFDFWANHLGADRNILGSTVAINGRPFQVIGVAPPGFHSAVWGESPGVFVPMSMVAELVPTRPTTLADHTDRWLNIVGRLKPGETTGQAEVAMQPLWHALRAEELKALGKRSPHFIEEFLTTSRLRVLAGASGFSYDRSDYRTPLLAVMAMALLVLLIASLNVGSLLLVRSSGRLREFSLRYALGARVTRILQQLLLEGLLIGLAGGAAGLALAPFAIRMLISRIAGDQAYQPFSSAVDLRLAAFSLAAALAASIFFSLAPAIELRKPDLTKTLRQAGSSGSATALSFRRAIVSLQVGLSVLLLLAAGLFVRTMQNLSTVDVGFSTEHLVTFAINPALAGYAPSAIPAVHQRVIDAMAALPGVEGVAATDDPELAGHGQGGNMTVAGFSTSADQDYDVEQPFVNPAFFSVMQVPLLGGRFFTAEDDASHPHVAIVNETFAKHFCGSVQACLGRRAANGAGNNPLDLEIVGVVRDTKHEGLRAAVDPTLFRPLQQATHPTRLYFYLRTATLPAQALSDVRRAIAQLDPSLTLAALRTMDTQIADSLSTEHLVAFLALCFGGLATLLAGVGIYGVLAYTTAQRTREIGIRIALGSSRAAVSRIILADVLKLAGTGIAIALPAGFALSHLVRSQLFGVSPGDPLVLATAGLAIATVAIAAALIPARRAATIDPADALRTE